MPQFASAMKILRADLVDASDVFLCYADMNFGITDVEAAVINKMIIAQMNLVEDLAFFEAP